MNKNRIAGVCGLISLVVVPVSVLGAEHAMTDAEQIRSAVSAAPKEVGDKATVVKFDANGHMQTLRQGTNEFTCMADAPETPGPDPMCMDHNSMGWVEAWLAHTPPPAGKPGLMYMLAGGTDASNTDPHATAPSDANHWIKTGPHIMIMGAERSFYDQYSKSADPDTRSPYVMWAGTPYEHLMIPVK